MYGREGEVCPDFIPSPQTNGSKIAAMNRTPASVCEKNTSLKERNKKQRTIKMDSDGKTMLFTAAIIFNLAQNLEVHIVKWSILNGVGEVSA
jgi:hypothetical protein